MGRGERLRGAPDIIARGIAELQEHIGSLDRPSRERVEGLSRAVDEQRARSYEMGLRNGRAEGLREGMAEGRREAERMAEAGRREAFAAGVAEGERRAKAETGTAYAAGYADAVREMKGR